MIRLVISIPLIVLLCALSTVLSSCVSVPQKEEFQKMISRSGISTFQNVTPYCVYYGNWSSELIDSAFNFKVVILHPKSNVDRNLVAGLQEKGIVVIGYLSVGEDSSLHHASASGGNAGKDSIHANWYYYDDNDRPVKNGIWDSYYTKASNKYWRRALKRFTMEGDQGWYGYDYIINNLGCDGLFLDTMDTHCPVAWGGFADYEGLSGLIDNISLDIGPDKLIIINRGMFLFDNEIVPERLTNSIRKNISGLMFENFYNTENRSYWIKLLQNQSRKSDGFSVITLDYPKDPKETHLICKEVITQCGWTPYLGDISLSDTIHNEATDWIEIKQPSYQYNP